MVPYTLQEILTYKSSPLVSMLCTRFKMIVAELTLDFQTQPYRNVAIKGE